MHEAADLVPLLFGQQLCEINERCQSRDLLNRSERAGASQQSVDDAVDSFSEYGLVRNDEVLDCREVVGRCALGQTSDQVPEIVIWVDLQDRVGSTTLLLDWLLLDEHAYRRKEFFFERCGHFRPALLGVSEQSFRLVREDCGEWIDQRTGIRITARQSTGQIEHCRR